MDIPFIKMHGLGNDYIFFDCLNQNFINDPSQLSIRLSDRHFGIGADGIVLILPSQKANLKMRIFNADGSEAEMCGNAIRCIAKYIFELNPNNCKQLTVDTLAGLISVKINTNTNNKFISATVNMGMPKITKQSIILNDNTTYKINCVNIGNPHAVVFVDDITDLQVLKHGSEIENYPIFSNKTNVEFAKIIDKNTIKMRVWERGTGETLACGTGATATAAAAFANKLTNKNITVKLLGGELQLKQTAKKNIYMTGTAQKVFTGIIKIN